MIVLNCRLMLNKESLSLGRPIADDLDSFQWTFELEIKMCVEFIEILGQNLIKCLDDASDDEKRSLC